MRLHAESFSNWFRRRLGLQASSLDLPDALVDAIAANEHKYDEFEEEFKATEEIERQWGKLHEKHDDEDEVTLYLGRLRTDVYKRLTSSLNDSETQPPETGPRPSLSEDRTAVRMHGAICMLQELLDQRYQRAQRASQTPDEATA